MVTILPQIQIGVMGGAFQYNKKSILASYCVGKTIALNKCTLITGATTGNPYAAALGCSSAGGFCIGISPGKDVEEHIIKYKKPIDGLNGIIYTGMGFNGREPINIASCDGIIYIGGEFGTLIEFGQGYYNAKILGVLIGVGGISDKLKEILSWMKTDHGSKIIYNSDPKRLVLNIIREIRKDKRTSKDHFSASKNLGADVRAICSQNKDY